VRLVLLGPPGAGKGTQASVIAKELGVPAISTGDLFRANVSQGTELGKQVQAFMASGQLVPDEVTVAMVRDRLAQPDAEVGFLLDGFPRTIPQAHELETILSELNTKLDVVLEMVVDDAEVIKRLGGRRNCHQCSRLWHLDFMPWSVQECPRNTEDPLPCDLYQREDDSAETVTNRLKVYHAETRPLVAHYAAAGILVGIDAHGPVEDVTTRALDVLRDRS
jgi:adenylate kinase